MWYFITGFICFWLGYIAAGLMAASSYASRVEEILEQFKDARKGGRY